MTLTAFLLAILWLAGCGKSKPAPDPPVSATPPTSAPTATTPAFSKLNGKW